MEQALANAGTDSAYSHHKKSVTNVSPGTKKKSKKPIDIDSDYEEILSEQFDTFTDNSPSKMGAYAVQKNLEIKKFQ